MSRFKELDDLVADCRLRTSYATRLLRTETDRLAVAYRMQACDHEFYYVKTAVLPMYKCHKCGFIYVGVRT